MNLKHILPGYILFLLFSSSIEAATFTVDSALDGATAHDSSADGLCKTSLNTCTLRAAIEEANRNVNLDVIEFHDALAGSVITLANSEGPLPAIVRPVQILGESIAAYNSAATLLRDAPPQITLDGGLLAAASARGLVFDGASASQSIVSAMSIVGFPSHGVHIINGANGLLVRRNFIGVRPDRSNSANDGHGLFAQNSGQLVIGKVRLATPAYTGLGNVFSNNGGQGVHLSASDGNELRGNLIGISPSGTSDRGNGGYGIYIFGNNNIIGDRIASVKGGNFIAGNDQGGMLVWGTNNRIQVNTLGEGETGSFISSEKHGIKIYGGGNYVGDIDGNGNSVFEHDEEGVLLGQLVGASADNNFVIGNQIGSPGSQFPVLLSGNGKGIVIANGDGNEVKDNVVIRSATFGIQVLTNENAISGNQVGFVNFLFGPLAEPNQIGMQVEGNSNTIGLVGHPNLIGGNTNSGLSVRGQSNTVYYNLIGVNASYEAIGNGDAGITVAGGDHLLRNNIIGFNGLAGMELDQFENLLIYFNRIGLTPTGDDIGNGRWGIQIYEGNNSDIHNNQIAYNGDDGIATFSTTNRGLAWFQNTMFDNNGLGIDLSPGGVTPNDPGDSDLGSNKLMNYPVIQTITVDDSVIPRTITIEYSVDATAPNAVYPLNIDFYWSDVDEPAQGRYFLGTDTGYVTSNVVKAMTFDVPEDMASGWLTATALDQDKNTSEMAARVAFTVPPKEVLFADGFED